MLSDNPRKQAIPAKRGRAVGATQTAWSDSQKLEAITTYLSLGNLNLAAKVLKMPEQTLRTWKKKDWWKELELELKTQESLQMSARLKRIVERTLAATEDRLEHGDYFYDNKTGEIRRKPVSMKDAHKVTMDMMDRRDILDNRVPTSVSVEQIDDKLKKLAEKFEQIAGIKPVVEVTDVIVGYDTDIPVFGHDVES